MVFTNVLNPRSEVSRKSEYQRTLVKRGATIGANATVVCGVTLGEYAFVGAGAVVTRDVEPFALVVGVPAARVGWMLGGGGRLPAPGVGGEFAAGRALASFKASGEKCGSRPRSSIARWATCGS